ncbi:MAG: hypothetical protein GXX99_02215 [Clostridiales bacterium]|nr:hypothetical protein [Clostridiales bacterium]
MTLLERYLYTLFVFALAGLLLLLHRRIGSDVRRQKKLLDERETGILKRYAGLEDAMDEFAGTVAASQEELCRQVDELQRLLAQARGQVGASLPAAAEPPARGRVWEVQEPPDEAPAAEGGFQLLFEQAAERPAGPEPARASATRYERIKALALEGLQRPQIARELGITQNEVDLVIGIGRAQP